MGSRLAKTDSKKRAVIEAVSIGHSITKAAEIAGIKRSMVYVWIDKDQEFAASLKSAEKRSLEIYEEETRRRAIDGVRKLKVHEGQPVFCWVDPQGNVVEVPPFETADEAKEAGYRREPVYETSYSDTLAIFRMKALDREKYSERIQAEVTLDIRKASDDDLNARLAQLLGSAVGGEEPKG